MAKDQHLLAGTTANRSLLANVFAWKGERGQLSLWQLGSWATTAGSALVIAFLAINSSSSMRADPTDLTAQSQQIQPVAKDSQIEIRRLSLAIDTLNGDRDRLYARVTTLEQGLDSVTGSVARQVPPASLVISSAQLVNLPLTTLVPSSWPTAGEPSHTLTSQLDTGSSAPAEQSAAAAALPTKDSLPAPKASTQLSSSPARLIETQPIPPVVALETGPGEPIIASLPKVPETTGASGGTAEIAVQRTEFGVDLGGAKSVDGLRAIWQSVIKANTWLVTSLRPIIVVKERHTGLGLQLRLVAGPLTDAAAAEKTCAALAEKNRTCEATVFEGQRLELKPVTEQSVSVAQPPRKRTGAPRPRLDEPSTLPPGAQSTQPPAQQRASAPAG